MKLVAFISHHMSALLDKNAFCVAFGTHNFPLTSNQVYRITHVNYKSATFGPLLFSKRFVTPRLEATRKLDINLFILLLLYNSSTIILVPDAGLCNLD